MKIYTSYFGNINKLRAAGIEAIGIARYKPRYFSGFNVEIAAPKAFMLKEDITVEQYVDYYQELVLDKLNIKEFVAMLERLGGGRDVALCCYEKPGQFCHRHLLADWLNEKAHLGIKEFGVVEKKPVDDSPTLF